MWISFSGISGSGKTTQAQLLEEKLKSMKIRTEYLQGFKPSKHVMSLRTFSEKIQKKFEEIFTPELISLSLLEDLYTNIKEIIEPSVKEGKIVITEMSGLCCDVYAQLLGNNQEIVSCLTEGLAKPGIYIFLDIEPKVAYLRLKNRNGNMPKPKREDIDIMIKSRERYRKKLMQQKNVVILDVNDKTIEEVNCEIIRNLYERGLIGDELI